MAQNYVLLERIELNQTASSVTFSNIPQTGYTDLKLVYSVRANNASNNQFTLSFNGSASGYTDKLLEGNGATVASYSNAGGTTTGIWCGSLLGSTQTANTFDSGELYIPNYTSSNYKSVSVDYVTENNATLSYTDMAAGLWSNAAAITSLKLTPGSGSFVSGSTFSLYGIANASTTPAIAPKADGGNVIATDGTYWYHAFLSSGTFTPQVGLNADVLVVAGGGGGGGYSGAGGGAGGLLAFTSQSLTATGYTCTVGAGGAGNTNGGSGVGADSQFGALTLVKGGGYGGGGNGTQASRIGGNGGSSGGGGGAGSDGSGAGQPGTATSGQGSSGGNSGTSPTTNTRAGGGGGGIGAIGANASSNTAGNGGAGVNTYSSWATATNTGVSGYYAGGGGGGTRNNAWGTSPTNVIGTGGSGGGGNGGGATNADNGVNGVANTGGGGGGGAYGSSGGSSVGGNGGAGIIIVRYLVA